ncbi:hypothetical protein BOTBODRAFT_193029 [Botryobasidium botryosum FD-172 SS1]|uniref:Phosphoribulokinase/uridine kinase domain-containing protein n=1 Tax=Botryobasidium botryosum (strain FD-172 SS1) TaxID=930990 RepID=A0A067M4I1_BOTB1|nr:hypothetical protein BOTBODRAFT_193029 [Botryobasidium botryosum FD-172 SS1]
MTTQVPSNASVHVVMIAIGGATCCGKTTLAKQLRKCLPDSIMIHQDDFFPPNQDNLPYNEELKEYDWDNAATAIDWPKFVASLEHVKRTGRLPDGHTSWDNCNDVKEISASDDVLNKWRNAFLGTEENYAKSTGKKLVWIVVEGFLLFWHQAIVDLLDARIFLRAPRDIIKERRLNRPVYYPAEGLDEAWVTYPAYWDQLVYPAYVRAHNDLFEAGDIEHGKLSGKIQGLLLLEPVEVDMSQMVDAICQHVLRAANEVM